MYKADDLVCNVLADSPEVFRIFEKHGMCQDCKDNPPPVPVSHFADRHCGGDVDSFLQELNAAIV